MTITKYDAAYFSDISYEDNNPGFELDFSYRESGWEEITNSDKLGIRANGYYGTAYAKIVDDKVVDVVIAHRGTELKWNDLISDGQIVTDGLIPNNQVNVAERFVDRIKLQLETQYGTDTNFDAITTQTGHSLGGYLAIYAADYQSSQSGERIKAITFDNPKTGLTEETGALVETYLNQPNWVNEAGNGDHIGKVFRLKSDLFYGNSEYTALMQKVIVQSVTNLANADYLSLSLINNWGIILNSDSSLINQNQI